MILPMIGMPEGWEWLVLLAIFILVFGATKLPEVARGTGQALRIFKSELRGLENDHATGTESDTTADSSAST